MCILKGTSTSSLLSTYNYSVAILNRGFQNKITFKATH